MRIRSLVKIQFSSWFFNLLCVDGRMDHVLTIPNIRFNEVEKCLHVSLKLAHAHWNKNIAGVCTLFREVKEIKENKQWQWETTEFG